MSGPTPKHHIAMLKRRLGFIQLKANKNDASAKAMSWLKAEINALQWAIAIVETLQISGRLVEKKPCEK